MITSPPLRAWADNTHREAILLFKVCVRAHGLSREFEFEFDGMKITS